MAEAVALTPRLAGGSRAGRRAGRRLWGAAAPSAEQVAAGLDPGFQALFDTALEGKALLDAAGRLLRANAALARLAGSSVPLAPGLPAERLVAPAARPALAALVVAAAQGVLPGAAVPLRAAPADPTASPDAEWEIRAGRLGAEGKVLLLHVTDRTELKRSASRLAASARLETVGRLAGGIAHDFNNLLAAVLGASEVLRGVLPPDPAGSAAAELATIEDAARRGAALVRQLLAFARQQQLQPRLVDVRRAVEEIAPLLSRLLGGGVRVELALEGAGAAGEGPLVRVDPAQLDQVLLNLAANAREAMPKGGRLHIALRRAVVLRPEGEGPEALPPGRYVVLEVADTGTGIPEEVLPRLFEPFFTTRPDRGGTGLGLAMVQGIVAQSGGHIAVETRPGEGTTFRIHLPRQSPEATAPETRTTEADSPPAPPVPTPGGPILLAEDEAPLRRLAEQVLRRAGHQVLAADCAEAALDLAEALEAPPAALVSDVAMPGADGLSLARQLRARWPGLPVLLLSGYAEVMLGEDLAAAGIRFLAKPFAPKELLAMLAPLLAPQAAMEGESA